MIQKNLLGRAEKFSTYSQKPVIFVQNLFNDELNYWFIAENWKAYNPSSHIHYNELRGKNITEIMGHTDEYDQVKFLTTTDQIHDSTIKFDNSKSWVMINPIIVRL